MKIRTATKLRTAVFKAIEEAEQGDMRPHLGASLIGDDCLRKIWYTFRWWYVPRFDGRILRLFRRGHIEEPFVADDIARVVGCVVEMSDPETGKQFRLHDPEMPAFGGSMDGKVSGIPDAPERKLGLEVKTMKTASFNKVKKQGVKVAEPSHYAQQQTYEALCDDVDGMLYVAVSKEKDDMYYEIIEPDRDAQLEARETAPYNLGTEEPPDRLSSNPGWHMCEHCQAKEVCHYDAPPTPNCRNCSKVQPRLFNGEHKWICTFDGSDLNEDAQRVGCAHYVSTAPKHSALRILV